MHVHKETDHPRLGRPRRRQQALSLALFALAACSSRTAARDAAVGDARPPGTADVAAAATPDAETTTTPETSDAGMTDDGTEPGTDAASDSADPNAGRSAEEIALRELVARESGNPPQGGPPYEVERLPSGLSCPAAELYPEDVEEKCLEAESAEQGRLDRLRVETLELLRERKFDDARRSVASWVKRHPCSASCEVPRTLDGLAVAIELAAATDEALGGATAVRLEKPVRLFVREWARPQLRPADDAPPTARYGLDQDEPVDAWGYLPTGWVLLADPRLAGAFEVGNPPDAALGWVHAGALAEMPLAPPVMDVGYPLRIVRPWDPAPLGMADDGAACRSDETPGRWYGIWPDERGECVPFELLCGAVGLVPPSWDLPNSGALDGCADCAVEERSEVSVGDYCRSLEPGWTWQCSDDGTQLLCLPPGSSADTTVAAPEEIDQAVLSQAAAQAGEEYDAWVGEHTAETELAALRALLSTPEFLQRPEHPLLAFHVRAHPAEVWDLAWASGSPLVRAVVLGAVARSGWLPQLDGPRLAQLQKYLGQDPSFMTHLLRRPHPQFRQNYRTAAAQIEGWGFMGPAKVALACLDAEGADGLAAAAVQTIRSDPWNVDVLLDGCAAITRDPRPVLGALLEWIAQTKPDTWVLANVRPLFVALTGRDLPPDEWPAFWESHRERTVDEWLAEAAAAPDPWTRRSAWASLAARQPSDAGRTALVAALADADPDVRLAAALALAAWGDTRAVAVLLEQLERSAAFTALGAFHDTTFGWDPQESAVERAAARARWAEWAKRSAFASEIR
jgi:hypothetical protein